MSDLYPNQGDNLSTASDFRPWTPPVDEERSETEKEEMLKIASSAAVIQDVIKWLNDGATGYSTDNITAGVNTPAEEIKASHLLAQNMRDQFRKKAREFEDYYRDVIRPKEAGETQN
jgi:hypothetical protein